MKPVKFVIEQGKQDLISHSGLAPVGLLLGKTRIAERVDKIYLAGRPRPAISNGDVLKSMIALMCMGKPDFDAIEAFREEPFFALALRIKQTPSSPTMRQRLDEALGNFNEIILEESADMVKRHATEITPWHGKLVPLDLDLTALDNSGTQKEGVSRTYQGLDGYGLSSAYLGKEGYLVHMRLQEGKQHCQKDMDILLRQAIGYSRRITDAPLLARMDAGNDSLDNLKVCLKEKVHWLIKRNLRNEDPEEWIELAKKEGKIKQLKPGIYAYYGDIYVEREGIAKPLRIVYQVIERRVDKHGNALLIWPCEVNTFWTSLRLAAATVVKLYHKHATCEQFHSELKTDLYLERLPSGKFDTNALVILCGLVAYNIMRLMGQASLRVDEDMPPQQLAPIRKNTYRKRIRTVMQDLMFIASRLIYGSRRWGLSFGCNCPWFGTWQRIYEEFSSA